MEAGLIVEVLPPSGTFLVIVIATIVLTPARRCAVQGRALVHASC